MANKQIESPHQLKSVMACLHDNDTELRRFISFRQGLVFVDSAHAITVINGRTEQSRAFF